MGMHENVCSNAFKSSPMLSSCVVNLTQLLFTFSQEKNPTFVRRGFITKTLGSAAAIATSTSVLFPQPSVAEIVVPPQSNEYSYPQNFGLSYQYMNKILRKY